jgi:hypothetical protein
VLHKSFAQGNKVMKSLENGPYIKASRKGKGKEKATAAESEEADSENLEEDGRPAGWGPDCA